MVEDRFNHWCSVWAKEFAILHPDDLSQEERLRLHEHASTCTDCAIALQQYLLCNALLRDHPFEEMFLAESAATIQTDGKVPVALEQLWEKQNSIIANQRREQREKHVVSKLNEGNQRATPSVNTQTIEPLPHDNEGNQRATPSVNTQAIEPLPHDQVVASPMQLGRGTCIIDLLVQCSNDFSDALAGGVERTELIVECIVSTALLAIYDTVHVELVAVYRSPEEAAQGLGVNYLDFAEGRQIS